MSPVPEPMHGGRQGPGGGGGEEDEDLTSPSNLPPGLLLPSSSDEELDLGDPENAPPGYQPLPQDYEDEDQECAIDYSSLSGLMSALATHGPNSVPAQGEEEEEGAAGIAEDRENKETDRISALVEESAQVREAAAAEERAAVWRCDPPAPDRLELDCRKVEQIKSAMASFTLPESAIPPWAQNLSEEEWKSQVSGLLAKRSYQ